MGNSLQKVWQVVRHPFQSTYTGYQYTADKAKALGASVALGTAVMLGVADTAVADSSAKIGEALLNGVQVSTADDGKQYYTLADETVSAGSEYALDETALAKQFEYLKIDLVNANGSLNKDAELLANPNLVNRLINISLSNSQDSNYSLVKASRETISELITHSAKAGGWIEKACPQEIIQILNCGAFGDKDSYKDKIKRNQAAVKLILQIAKNNPELNLKDAVADYIHKMPNYFHGIVGNSLQPILENVVHEILANPSAIINDPEINTDPALARDLAQSFGNLFLSCVSKPFRNNELVIAAKDLLIAYEDEGRNSYGQVQLGINKAREIFIDKWRVQVDAHLQRTEEITSLIKLRRNIDSGIRSGLKVYLPREFCSVTQRANSNSDKVLTQVTAENLRLVDIKIHELTGDNQKKTEEFQKGLVAIGRAFEATASPFGDGPMGLKNLWFTRLFANTASESDLDDNDKSFTALMYGIDGETTIDYTQLDNPNYGNDFTGAKKIILDSLQRRWAALQEEASEIKLNLEANAETYKKLNDEFTNPLACFIPANPSDFNMERIETMLTEFCNSKVLVEDTLAGFNSIKKTQIAIINNLIVKDANGKFIINDSEVDSLQLRGLSRTQLFYDLKLIIDAQTNHNLDLVDLDYYPSDFLAGKILENITTDEAFARATIDEIRTGADEDTRSQVLKLLADERRFMDDVFIRLGRLIKYEKQIVGTEQVKNKYDQLIRVLVDSSVADEAKKLDIANIEKNLGAAPEISKQRKLMGARFWHISRELDKGSVDFEDSWERAAQDDNTTQAFDRLIKSGLTAMQCDVNNVGVLREEADRNLDFFVAEQDPPAFTQVVTELLKSLVQFIRNLTERK